MATTYTPRFNLYNMRTECIFVFCVSLKISGHLFSVQRSLIGICKYGVFFVRCGLNLYVQYRLISIFTQLVCRLFPF
jgi:hypothetical protein